MIFKVPSNPKCSMILRFYDSKSQISRGAIVVHEEVTLHTAAGAEHLRAWGLPEVCLALWRHLVDRAIQPGMWPEIQKPAL